jgi:uncharacterized protein YigE (DUF2233 family)
MKSQKKIVIIAFGFLFLFGSLFSFIFFTTSDSQILSYIVDPKVVKLRTYWKSEKGEILKDFQKLKLHVEQQGDELLFAMNGGMFMENYFPLGLYIENGKLFRRLNNADAHGNFYLKPNGVFYITADNQAVVVKTSDFKNDSSIVYATQSGPLLLIDGKIHPAFRQASANLNIRNGVGVLPDGKVLFAISKEEINFYDFALFFQQMGCKNALYLDGFVSRAYFPEKNWVQTHGDFGVMIGVTKPKAK